MQALDVDFYAFSGHKLYGPTGMGVLYGKAERLAALPPYQGGGEMIGEVSEETITYADAAAPFRGRHPAHRRGHRPGRRHRLAGGPGPRRRRWPTRTRSIAGSRSGCAAPTG